MTNAVQPSVEESAAIKPLEVPSGAGAPPRKSLFRASYLAYLFVLLFGLACLSQFLAGAYDSEFAGYPDEGSHFITGVMIRDYVAGGFPAKPLKYAYEYYRHYPRISFGHWPPLYYSIEAAWFLVFPVSRGSALMFIAVSAALAAAVLIAWLRWPLGLPAAAFVGVFWLALPAVQENISLVMIEMFFAAVTFLAAWQCARHLDRPSLKSAGILGALIFLGVMTKGNGWLLAPLYVLALLLAGRPLFTWQSVLTGAIVALALPFQLLTLNTVQSALPGQFGVGPAVSSLLGFLASFPELCGWPVALLAAGQLVWLGYTSIRQRRYLSTHDAVMAALLLSTLVFHSVVNAGVESRKMIVGLPAILYFAAAGALNLLGRAPRLSIPPAARVAIAPALAIVAIAGSPIRNVPAKPKWGLTTGALPSAQDANVLVSGSGSFEGATVCEIAMLDRNRPHRYVFRGTKVLADTDWNSRNYRLKVDAAGLDHFLDAMPISWIALENPSAVAALPHHRMLLDLLGKSRSKWELVTVTQGDGTAGASIYHRVGPVPGGPWQSAWDQSPGSPF